MVRRYPVNQRQGGDITKVLSLSTIFIEEVIKFMLHKISGKIYSRD